MSLSFTPRVSLPDGAVHHEAAVAGNRAAATSASEVLLAALGGSAAHDKIFLRAAAGAGKSYALVEMVSQALSHSRCARVAVTAFANKQVYPLAERLGRTLGARAVCLFVSPERMDVPESLHGTVTIAHRSGEIPTEARVVLGTSHKFGAQGEIHRLTERLGPAANAELAFDVLLVDEAWQLPLHRFSTVDKLAPLTVGVGDVGQLPPIDPSANPWRGDPGYNPYRAFPTEYEGKAATFSIELPAVWRPRAEQLALWRSFYADWDRLDCVAAPEDRSMTLSALTGHSADVWQAVASGYPTLVEVAGLSEPEAPDIDGPLLAIVEGLLAELLKGGFAIHDRRYDGLGRPRDHRTVSSTDPDGDPLIVLLATRNQAVNDAADLVARLTERYDLPAGVLVASTVDSWQGQTNGITIALHPLSGASELDAFNSAFGRLSVTCTRATHGLLILARQGLDELLANAPARPGTPLGEPGTRTLPRQMHQRILATFTRAVLCV